MEKASRPIRNRRHSRRAWPPGDTHRPAKRLFTPEIKRMLKDWLVRRRENPYPSRDEKKILAHETGLTYIQICNWFANWRRKLKNSGREPSRKTWGNLIKNYNTNAKGNVEQFSICSRDSIWGDEERGGCDNSGSSGFSQSPEYSTIYENYERGQYHINNNSECYNRELNCMNIGPCVEISKNTMYPDGIQLVAGNTQAQCFQVSSTTDEKHRHYISNMIITSDEHFKHHQQNLATSNPKYKHQIMEKYLRDNGLQTSYPSGSNPELSKWLVSAAKFTPHKNNYIEWNPNSSRIKRGDHQLDKKSVKILDQCYQNMTIHQKEDLDAAEALLFFSKLAGNYRQRILTSAKVDSV